MRLTHALIVLVLSSLALAGPSSPETLRRDVQKALKLRAPGERANAIDAAFRDQDSGDAAQVAVDAIFDKDEAQMVIEAAMTAVGRMKDESAAGVLRKAAETGALQRRIRAIEALGRSSATDSATALIASSACPDVAIRAAAVTALGRKDETVVKAVEDALKDPAWTVRSAAISSLARLQSRKSVPALCAAMRAGDGRIVDACVATLRALTGQRFGADPAKYEEWWANESKTKPPEAAATPWNAPPWSFESSVLATRSHRVLFVLATGDTMKDAVAPAANDERVVKTIRMAGDDLADDLKAAKTKLDVARVHLRAMLRTLRDGVEFDVMSYSGSPAYAFGKLTPADAASKKRAESRIAGLSPGGPPNLHGALLRVFDPRGKDPLAVEDGPDTVILFTDGTMAEPGSKDPTEVGLSAIRWNAVRQIRFLVLAAGQVDNSVIGRLADGPPEGASASIP